jgi:hypothetical protein
MSHGFNWSKINKQETIRRHGYVSVKDDDPSVTKWLRQKLKAEHAEEKRCFVDRGSMTHKFGGTFNELERHVLMVGLPGYWDDHGNHKQFRADNGAILNWWQSTKTVTFQGPAQQRDDFASLFSQLRCAEATRRKPQ